MAVPELRAVVERHFRVYEAREEKLGGQVAARIFFVMFPPTEHDARFEALRTELKAIDPELVMFLRRDGGEDVLYIAERPPPPPRDVRLAATLLLLTVLTTLMAGVINWQGYERPLDPFAWSSFTDPRALGMGFLTFTLPLMAILGVHEMAHYVAARLHGLRPSLPRFLPMPPILMPFGTLGAFISMRDDMPDRKALFDVGASGPIAGFLVAIPIILLGAHLTATQAHGLPDYGEPTFWVDRDHAITLEGEGRATGGTIQVLNASAGTFAFSVTAPPRFQGPWQLDEVATVTFASGNTTTDHSQVSLEAGATDLRTFTVPPGAAKVELKLSWDDHLTQFGDPLLVKLVDRVFPSPGNVLSHPVYIAGWVGLLVTGINLIPAGQLDGGHIARALLGDRMKYAAYAAVAALLYLAYKFPSWMLMALLVVVMGIHHPPPLNERTPLGRLRTAIGIGVVLVFLLTFIPQPFQ